MSHIRVPKEIHRKIFELTLALYRVTDFLPQGEALRRSVREKGNEIFGGISEYDYAFHPEDAATAILGKIQSLKGYFAIARAMRFVKPINLTILGREYDFLANFFVNDLEALRNASTLQGFPKKLEEASSSSNSMETREARASRELNERQKRILEYFSGTPHAKISDVSSMFVDISTKTIQRDLQDLVTKNILKKEGEKRWTVYALNSVSESI